MIPKVTKTKRECQEKKCHRMGISFITSHDGKLKVIQFTEYLSVIDISGSHGPVVQSIIMSWLRGQLVLVFYDFITKHTDIFC